MYYETIRQFVFCLNNLDAILAKAENYAATRGFDVNNFVTARIAPDMLPFSRQIQIACDVAKSAASTLVRRPGPRHEDNETTFAQLRARVHKVVELLNTYTEQDFADLAEDTLLPVAYPAGKAMHAGTYLRARAVPNFYFHLTTTYALLRAGGVDLGKSDYLGNLPLFDAT